MGNAIWVLVLLAVTGVFMFEGYRKAKRLELSQNTMILAMVLCIIPLLGWAESRILLACARYDILFKKWGLTFFLCCWAGILLLIWLVMWASKVKGIKSVRLERAKLNIPSQTIPEVNLQAGASKRCPFCAETIKAKAAKCRYCGSSLVTTQK